MKHILLLVLLFGGATAVLRAQTTCANRCLNFDGKDDYVQLSKSPIQGNVNFTIEGWFRSLDNDGLTTCPNGNFERIIGCGGSRLEIGECSGTFAAFIAGSYLSSGVKSGDGLWHHFAVAKDGPACWVYLDGNIVITHNLPASPAFALDNVFRIGRWAGGGGLTESWQGDVDEIRVWDSALPETTLWPNMSCKLTGQEAGLLAYYNFDQGAPAGVNGTVKTLTDLSASKNNGTLNGLALTGAGSNWICSGTPQTVFCGDPAMTAPSLVAPAGNAIVQTSPRRTLRFEWSAPYAQGQDVRYKIEIFKNKTTGDSAVQTLELVRVVADSFTNRLNADILVERLQPALKKLERYFWKVTAKYGPAGSPCANGCASEQSGFSILANDYDVNVKVTGSATCANPAYDANGNVRYNVSITLTNLSLGSAGAGVPINFWRKPPPTSSGLIDQILLYQSGSSVFGAITNPVFTPPLSSTSTPSLNYNGATTLTFTIALPIGSTAPLVFQGCFHSVATNVDGTPLVSYNTVPLYLPLPPCVCQQKECILYIGGSTTPTPKPYPASPDYDILEINHTITTIVPSTVTRVMAEVIYFDHSLKPNAANCCSVVCNKQASSHAELVGTGTVLSTSPFTGWQNNGQPMDFIDGSPGTPDFESGAATWYSTTSAGTAMNSVPLHLEIAIPELSYDLSQKICDCHRLCIRYTFFDKDCKLCERTVSYNTCQSLPPGFFNCR